MTLPQPHYSPTNMAAINNLAAMTAMTWACALEMERHESSAKPELDLAKMKVRPDVSVLFLVPNSVGYVDVADNTVEEEAHDDLELVANGEGNPRQNRIVSDTLVKHMHNYIA